MRGRKPSDFKAGAAASEVSARQGGHEGVKRPLAARAPRPATTGCAAGQDMEVHFAHLDLHAGERPHKIPRNLGGDEWNRKLPKASPIRHVHRPPLQVERPEQERRHPGGPGPGRGRQPAGWAGLDGLGHPEQDHRPGQHHRLGQDQERRLPEGRNNFHLNGIARATARGPAPALTGEGKCCGGGGKWCGGGGKC